MNHLEDWLRAAYAAEDAGCPPPEAYLEDELAALSEADRRRLEEHAESCPACAAERELARAFDGTDAQAVSPEDRAFVVSRLEDSSPVTAAPTAKVVPFRIPPAKASEPPARRRTELWRIAAVAVLVLGAGILFQLSRSGAPPLPPPSGETTVRGGEIEALLPVGDVADLPRELRWEPRTGAVTYRVRLLSVDDTVLWEADVPAPPARLPEAVSAGLHRAVSYTWTVEALDASGRRLAVSEPTKFRARPAP